MRGFNSRNEDLIKKNTLEEAKEVFLNNNLELLEDEYKNIDYRMKCIDIDGYKYSTNLYVVKKNLFNASHKFSIKNPFAHDNYLNYIKLNVINNTILLSQKSVRDGETLKFNCGLCGSDFEQYWKVFRDFNPYHCCQLCAKSIAVKNETNPIDLIDSEIKKLNLKWISGEYINRESKLHIEDDDGYKGIISFTSLKAGCSFMKFYIGNIYTIENLRLYSSLNSIDVYIPNQNYDTENQDVNFICECGNSFNTTLDTFFHGKHKCNICTKSQSNYETKVEEYLNKYNIKFIKQYKYEDCRLKKPLPFDFYIHNYGLLEVDGEGHYNPTRFNGVDMTRAIDVFKKTKINDQIKDNYCKNNNIKLLRLSYIDINNNKYIKILNNELKSIIV